MAVAVIWDDEAETTLRQIYSGVLTLQDYIQATNELERLAKTKAYTVHSIMDRTEVISTPGVLLPALRYANSHLPPNLGVRLIINAGMLTRFIVDLGRRTAPKLVQNIYFANTLDEARTIIAQHSESRQDTI